MCHVLHWCQLRKSASGAGKARRWMDLWVQNRKQLEVPFQGEGNIKLIHQQWHNFTSHRERTLPSCWWTDKLHIHANNPGNPGMQRSNPRTLTGLTGESNPITDLVICVCLRGVTWKSALIVFLSGFHSLWAACLLVSPLDSGCQSKPVPLKSRILPGWCSIHLFTLWYESCVWSSPLRIYQSDVSGFLCFFLLFIRIVHSSTGSQSRTQNFVRFLPGHTEGRAEVCGALLRASPTAQYKMVSSFPRAFIFCSITPNTFPVLPWGPANSLAPASCYSEISLFILDSVILLKHWYFPAISLLHGDAY